MTAVFQRSRDVFDRSARSPDPPHGLPARPGALQRSAAIKCSDCGRQVALADLQDHACSPALSMTPTLGSSREPAPSRREKPPMQIKMPRPGGLEGTSLASPSVMPRSPATSSSSAGSPGLPNMAHSPSARSLPFFERWAKGGPFGSSGSVSSSSTGATSVSGREDSFKYEEYLPREPPKSTPMPSSTSSRSLSSQRRPGSSRSVGSDGRDTPMPRSTTDTSLSSSGRGGIGAAMLGGHQRSDTASSSSSSFGFSAYGRDPTSPSPLKRSQSSDLRRAGTSVGPAKRHGLGVTSGMTRSQSARSDLTRPGPSAQLDDLISSLNDTDIDVGRSSLASTNDGFDAYYAAEPARAPSPAPLCLACSAAPATASGDLCSPCYKVRYLPKCRKCKLAIEGRAVGSGDGKVKGKFHVECFNCFSCHAPFPSGEFYVFDERPYCSPHYHALAGSLCTNCDRGIEGSCVSLNESGRKYHPSCFKCSQSGCSILLPEEHYLLDGLPYCERHAEVRSRRAAGGANGTPGKRAEKRRTVVAPLARRR